MESGRFIYNNRGSLDATLEWLSQSVDLPAAFPSVHRDGGSIAIRDAAVWIAVAIGMYALVTGVRTRSVAIKWAVGSLALGLSVMAGAGIVWSLHGSPALTEDRSKVAAFGAYRPSWHTTIDVSGRRSISQSEWLAAMAFPVRTSGSRINRVPAGDYKVHANLGSIEPVSMFVGRNDPPIESPTAEDLHDDRSSFRLRLPVASADAEFQEAGRRSGRRADADSHADRVTTPCLQSECGARESVRSCARILLR